MKTTKNKLDPDYKSDTPDELKNLEYSYKLIKGGDGYLYVSIQPLMKDVAKSMAKMQEIDTSGMNEETQRIFELKLLGLMTVYEFLGAFVTEQQLKDKAEEIKGTVNLNVDDGYKAAGVS
jgi:hypothetical protein